MSIPPLVCSTPPPLEQVECDDAGHDEFAVQYGSSQDDDDELCRYEDFQSTVPASPYRHTQHVDHSPKSNNSNSTSPERPQGAEGDRESDKDYEDILPPHTKTAVDEDNLIEDLDLKFEPLTVKPNIPEDSGKDDKTTTNNSLETQSHTVFNQESIKKNADSGIGHTSSIETIDPHESTTSTVLCKTESVNVDDISKTENVNIDESESELNIDEREYSPSTQELHDSDSTANKFHTDSSGIDLSGDLSLEREEDFNDFHFVPTEINLEQEILDDLGFHQTPNTSHNPLQLENNNTREGDDDFNDSDTFHINSTLDNIVENVLDNVDPDPWKSEVAAGDDFGDFQATFSDDPSSAASDSPLEADANNSKPIVRVDDDGDNDDDFGDFDDFKCSEVTTPTVVEAGQGEAESSHSLKSFDFKNTDSESQIYERIETLIHSLYEEQVTEPQPEAPEGSLECSLCETWGYLTQTEIRQPYMLNWNNSIGQKALLKSLCIDSRNILFGRKWSNMPRYAATLSTAPLQPVKQAPASGSTPSTSATENATRDKPNVKPIDTWSDSVAGEGQEFTYAENLLLDLEHLMATLDQMANNQSSLKISELLSHACNDTDSPSSVSGGNGGATREFIAYKEMPKPSKPFPPTLALQPLRQINLPDTHIFTPTDSEVPRSKTIHYDNIAPIAPQLPHQIVQNQTKVMQPCEQGDEKCGSSQFDNEYDEFQDFQDTSNQKSADSNMSNYFTNNLTQGSESVGIDTNKEALPTLERKVKYQTQTILEPIKLEPTMPTLNWPEPGEVKETFDDFSDFVANSTWSNFNAASTQNTNNQNPDPQKVLPKQSPQTELQNQSQTTAPAAIATDVSSVEDEFDNFQFVPTELPSRELESVSRIDPQIKAKSMQQTPIVNNLPPNGLMHPMVPLKMQSTVMPTHPVAPHGHVLQPVSLDRPGHGGQDKINSQQILQPLSLESFSQINWPSPGVDLQDLSRFNPINAVRSLHQSPSGGKSSPAHSLKGQQQEDDGWGDFVSIKPTKSPQHVSKPAADDDDWSDFVSSATSKPNGVNTISFNVHTNSSQKPASRASPDDARISIPTLNYITPKTNHRMARDNHFQNL